MKLLQEYVQKVHHYVTKKDWDNVVVITGYPGKGKSNLALHLCDEWLKLNNDESTTVDEVMALDVTNFAKNFQGAKKFGVLVHDEAGEIGSRQANTKMNKVYVKVYQIIRGLNMFTILCLPSLWDLDSYFRKRRVRHLFHVYKRGRVHYWGMYKYQQVVERNERMPVQNYYVVKPDFRDWFPIYKGRFKQGYDELKATRLQEAQAELPRIVSELQIKDKDNRDQRILELLREGTPITDIANKFNISRHTVYRVKRQHSNLL